ncbi:MAG: N-acetyltransferase [Bacteroidetes bacterium]|nr:N-acetyltransferase [Bacteroidota bacterium]
MALKLDWLKVERDAEWLLEIYKPFVLETAITFELELPTLSDFSARISKIHNTHPFIVAIENSQTIGYAYANVFRERKAYDWIKELSVYVHPAFQKKGVGIKLYQTLMEILTQQGICRVVGGIALPNEKSVKFHEKLGFQHVGTFVKSGYKFNQWWDVGFWDKELNSTAKEIIPISELRKHSLES